MEYSIRQLSEIAGISTRTLRYYDKIGLLKPADVRESGYRYYSEREMEMLQQILFYKERGLKLEQITEILHSKEFDVMSALYGHLEELEKQEIHISAMISTVKKTISSMKGEIEMSNREKFEAFKKNAVQENDVKYGEEARSKYGDEAIDASNRKLLHMTESEYEHFQDLNNQIQECLEDAVRAGEMPEGDAGKKAVQLHKEWLGMTWTTYTAQAHKGLAQMYTADERFTQYYDGNVKGCAQFLKSAVEHWAI